MNDIVSPTEDKIAKLKKIAENQELHFYLQQLLITRIDSLRSTTYLHDKDSVGREQELLRANLLLDECHRRMKDPSPWHEGIDYLLQSASHILDKNLGKRLASHLIDQVASKSFDSSTASYSSGVERDAANSPPGLIINLCCDQAGYRQVGRAVTSGRRGKFVETSPDNVARAFIGFEIQPGARVTIVGHNTTGSPFLKDNQGNAVSIDELAQRIVDSLGDDKSIDFTVSLIACQAASGNPSAAEQLMRRLAELGATGAKVEASPTSLILNYSGSIDAIRPEDDRRYRSAEAMGDKKTMAKLEARANPKREIVTFSWDGNNVDAMSSTCGEAGRKYLSSSMATEQEHLPAYRSQFQF